MFPSLGCSVLLVLSGTYSYVETGKLLNVLIFLQIILSAFSPYGKKLKDIGYTMTLKGVETTALQLYDKLIDSISKVYNDVKSSGTINKDLHRYEYELFHNEFGVVEGPW